MKKVLNIISYTLNVFFIGVILYGLLVLKTQSAQQDEIEIITSTIIKNETASLPLLIQGLDHVHSIAIDSMVVTNNVEPYTGYLVTTWDLDEKQNINASEWAANGYKEKYIRKEKTVYVGVNEITTEDDKITWKTGWAQAMIQARDNE